MIESFAGVYGNAEDLLSQTRSAEGHSPLPGCGARIWGMQ